MNDDLQARYGSERLPRYTSYPTAPQFSADVGPGTYAEWLASLDASETLSLYLHVPFCRSMCWYCGCHTTITSRDAPIVDYLGILRKEIDLVASKLGGNACGHVHFGGGTPTIMTPQEFAGLMALLRLRFPLISSAEVAVEIDPRTLGAEMAAALGASGVTRASLGVQSFDPRVQKAINRVQSVEQTAEAASRLRAAGVHGLNFDLIYGLPHQTVQSCIETVRQCLPMRPDRLSVFGYAHVPAFKHHQRRISEAALPGAGERAAQAEAIAGALQEAGYRRIGLDHFALPGDDMARQQRDGTLRRNFQGYTTDRSDTLVGLGASSIGRLPQGYAQNETVLGRYAERINRGELATSKGYALTADDRLRAAIIERLMCDFVVDVAELCRSHDAAATDLLGSVPRLQELQRDGLVEIDGGRIAVMPDARPFVRAVASAFDAYFGATTRLHSPAI